VKVAGANHDGMRAVMLAHKSSREKRTVDWGEAVE